MHNSQITIPDELIHLQESYLKSLPEKMTKIEQSWQRVMAICEVIQSDITWGEDGAHCPLHWNREELVCLHRLVHNLAGSGATFGLSQLGDMAHRLDLFLQSVLQSNHPPTLEQCNQISALLEALITIDVSLDEFHLSSSRLKIVNSPKPLLQIGSDRQVFLLEPDQEEAENLMLQLNSFGYRVEIFTNLANLKKTILYSPPAAIIMDILFVSSDNKPDDRIAAIHQELPWNVPILFMSLRDDLNARLTAVRAKGDAYFAKPINIWQLVDKLDRLVSHHRSDPYHILIVEDDSALADYYKLILQDAGMKTMVVTNPTEVMEPLIQFQPDLILMDVYMPDCTGLELAVVIRQQETFVGVPITYLSCETDLEKQMVAMSLGGDDFLTKPIQPDHLVAAVTSRVQRSRTLRSLMVRDSLTGLLNHTNIKEQLQLEIARSDRQNAPLSFAMLDIDNFKQINDVYGHLAGDRVIKNLARLLRQCLRQTDILGRYGGEEFAVILINTDVNNAFKIIEKIRRKFSQVHQQLGSSEIFVTFSCGIASFPDYTDANHLNDAADQALYQAKHQGKNCTVFARRD